MRRRYHLPTDITVPDGLSDQDGQRLRATVVAAIRRAVRDAAPGDTASTPASSRPQPRERVVGAGHDTYAVPSYDSNGERVGIPVASPSPAPVPGPQMSPRDPHNPHNTLTDREMFELWKGYWQRRLGRALKRERDVRNSLWSKDPIGYADDMNKFEQGLRSALGPVYQAAADELAFCQAITAEMESVLNWLESRQALGKSVTLDEVNARAEEEARGRILFETWISPIFMGVLTAGSLRRAQPLPTRVPELPFETHLPTGTPAVRPRGATGFAGAIRKVLAAKMIGLARAESATQGAAASRSPKAAVTERWRPETAVPLPADGPPTVTDPPAAPARAQQSAVAQPPADATPQGSAAPKAPASASSKAPKAPKPAAPFDAAGRERAAEKLAGKEQAVVDAGASVSSHRADQQSARDKLRSQAGARPPKPVSLKARLDRIDRLKTYEDKAEAVAELRRQAGWTAEETAYLDWLGRNYALQHDVQDSRGAVAAVTDRQVPAVTLERDAAQKALNQASMSLNQLMRSNGPNYAAVSRIQIDQVMSPTTWNALGAKPALATDHLVSLDRITKLPELDRLLRFYAQAPAEVQAVLREELAALGDLPDNLVRMRADANGSSLKSNKSWAEIPSSQAEKFGYSEADVKAVRLREDRAHAEILKRIEELTSTYAKKGGGRR
jgi:hypothetical protein